MFVIHIIVTLIAAYFAKEAYDDCRLGWAMFWAGLLGWDLHTLLSYQL